MSMMDDFLNKARDFVSKKPAVKEKVLKKSKSDKDVATAKGEPYVTILSMDVDPNNLSAGTVELDWNDKFILQLQRHGYVGKTDADMVDQWFTNVCRHIVMESYQQEMADPDKRSDARFIQDQKLDNGKREYR